MRSLLNGEHQTLVWVVSRNFILSRNCRNCGRLSGMRPGAARNGAGQALTIGLK